MCDFTFNIRTLYLILQSTTFAPSQHCRSTAKWSHNTKFHQKKVKHSFFAVARNCLDRRNKVTNVRIENGFVSSVFSFCVWTKNKRSNRNWISIERRKKLRQGKADESVARERAGEREYIDFVQLVFALYSLATLLFFCWTQNAHLVNVLWTSMHTHWPSLPLSMNCRSYLSVRLQNQIP